MDTIDNRDYDEIGQISENDEERVTDDTEVFKLVKLSSNIKYDNIEN